MKRKLAESEKNAQNSICNRATAIFLTRKDCVHIRISISTVICGLKVRELLEHLCSKYYVFSAQKFRSGNHAYYIALPT